MGKEKSDLGRDGVPADDISAGPVLTADGIRDCSQSLVSDLQTGQLPGQGAFTLHGCDLSTGEPKYELAGCGPIYKGE